MSNRLPLDHVAFAVPSIEAVAPIYQRLVGASPSPVETLPEQGVRVAFVGEIELLEPTGPETAVGRFLAKRGAGLHHVAYRVMDIEDELRQLSEAGFPLVDKTPRRGARGHRVAFLHPSGTGGLLIELVERS